MKAIIIFTFLIISTVCMGQSTEPATNVDNKNTKVSVKPNKLDKKDKKDKKHDTSSRPEQIKTRLENEDITKKKKKVKTKAKNNDDAAEEKKKSKTESVKTVLEIEK